MTDGIAGVLARMSELDSRIRAFDPTFSGTGAFPLGPAGSASSNAAAPFANALATAGAGAIASSPSGVGGASDPIAEAGQASASASSPAWAVPVASYHPRPAISASALGGVASTASVGAGTSVAAPYVPPLVSERIGSPPYTGCSWAATVMLMAKASAGALPTTAAEVLELRAAGGAPDGASTSSQNIEGTRNRYGFTPTKLATQADTLAKLADGWGAKLNLTYAELPPELRRHDPDFTGNHSVYVQDYRPADGTMLWLDPLAPAGSKGERVKVADVTKAVWWNDVVTAKQGSFAS